MSRYFFFCVSTLLFLIEWKSAVAAMKRNEGEQSNCFLEEEMEDIIIHVSAVSKSHPVSSSYPDLSFCHMSV